MPGLISVVVCTHDRADVLAGALLSLGGQTLDRTCYEVIVVDNNSTDNTPAVVEDFRLRFPDVRYYLETQQGLSHARNRGWREAHGEYIGYMDDDSKAPPEWLEVAKEVIDEQAPAAFGGPNYPFYNSLRPRWFKDEYGTHQLGPQARALDSTEYVYGMNVFFRRAVLETLGGFDPALGMCGKRIAYGEETAVLLGIRAEMPDEVIYYEPRLYVHHLVPARKMTWPWILRASWAGGRYSYLAFGEKRRWTKGWRGLVRALFEVMILGGVLLRGVLRRDRQAYPYFENYAYERVRRHLVTLGALFEQVRHNLI